MAKIPALQKLTHMWIRIYNIYYISLSTNATTYMWIRICGYVDKDTSLSTSVQPLIIRS